ncbi:MAG: hypothetical protein PVJ57_00510 [Phycisphaerae bacterium]
MGRFAYYSPVLLGMALVASLYTSVLDYCPAGLQSAQWAFVGMVALGAGVACQLVMVGAQGAFAQVMPVPRGRTVRGPAAVATGVLLLAALGLGSAAGLMALESAGPLATGLAVAGGASAAVMLVVYIWSSVTAVRDFAEED